jgi:DNA-binding transcriptional LysR family regulator
LSGELDAAFVAEPVAEEPFEKASAFIEELVMVAPAGHPPIAQNGRPPRTMVAFEVGCPHRKRLEDWYAARGEMPERTIELGSYHAMLGCIAAGMGVALLPRSVLSTFPERKQLSIHPMSRSERWVRTVLIWRRGAGSPKLAALKQMLLRERRTAAIKKGKT